MPVAPAAAHQAVQACYKGYTPCSADYMILKSHTSCKLQDVQSMAVVRQTLSETLIV